jgi:hypothetical protein
MNRDAAIEILNIAMDCSAKADGSVAAAQKHFGEAEFRDYRRLVGRVMANIFENIMVPIYEEHEDLKPDWYKEMDRQSVQRKEHKDN